MSGAEAHAAKARTWGLMGMPKGIRSQTPLGEPAARSGNRKAPDAGVREAPWA
jgi:hypothetical protein